MANDKLESCAAAVVASAALWCSAAFAAPPSEADTRAVKKLIASMAAELQSLCPVTDPGKQDAFDTCRKALFGPSLLRKSIGKIVLWGRQSNNADLALKESSLTQFAPDVWTGMYAPLFMFTGAHEVKWVESEKMFQAKLGAAFRNRLPAGQFPYPFWHEPAKWDAYENASAVILWFTPRQILKVGQFRWQDPPPPGVVVQHESRPKHDGQWLWTDSSGKTQPAVTLFDGLYSADNPNKKKVEVDYRALAISMRESQCLECHTPANKEKSKRLVLLQTPAHAAGEIERIMKSVREDRMPREEGTGTEAPLEPKMKETLLTLGARFEASVQAAKEWEKTHRE